MHTFFSYKMGEISTLLTARCLVLFTCKKLQKYFILYSLPKKKIKQKSEITWRLCIRTWGQVKAHFFSKARWILFPPRRKYKIEG